jgi:AcrR family transcriptional regulator
VTSLQTHPRQPESSTKQRILDATAELFRRYGYNGTGLKQIVAAANAPFGSIYHFFPGGKQQLGEEVVRRSGRMYQELVLTVLSAADDPVAGTSDIFTGAAEVLLATDFADACPIAAVALEVASADETLRAACSDVFAGWIAAGTSLYAGAGAGITAEAAEQLTVIVIELLEGAFLLCRAMRTTDPMAAAGAAAVALVRDALA